MFIYFEIPGNPGSKGRPRFKRIGNFTTTYTDEKTASYENLVKLSYQNQSHAKFKDDAQLYVTINAYFSIPKSTSKKQKDQMLNFQKLPTKKPDCDNIAKIILDSLNEIAFKDDSQVVGLTVNKYYSDEPRVEVTIEYDSSEQSSEHLYEQRHEQRANV